MGASTLRRLGDRLFSPAAGCSRAGFLAFVVAFPTTSEASPNGKPLEVSTECTRNRGPGRNPAGSYLQGAGGAEKDARTKRRLFSGKLGAALAAVLYCRKSVDVSALSGNAAACLPHRRHLSGCSIRTALPPSSGRAADCRLLPIRRASSVPPTPDFPTDDLHARGEPLSAAASKHAQHFQSRDMRALELRRHRALDQKEG